MADKKKKELEEEYENLEETMEDERKNTLAVKINLGEFDYEFVITHDYTLLIYPMHVLSTNRILDTIISRNENVNGNKMRQDFKDIRKLRGFKGYYYGLVPYTLNYFLNHAEFFGNADEEYNDKYGYYWFMLTLALWNPINILIVRM